MRDKTKLVRVAAAHRGELCDKNKLCVASGLILIAVVEGIIRLMC